MRTKFTKKKISFACFVKTFVFLVSKKTLILQQEWSRGSEVIETPDRKFRGWHGWYPSI